jgi:TIR domain/SIR2-like domain
VERSNHRAENTAPVFRPRRLFISYARDDATAVNDLHGDLARANHLVWFDRKLEGGQRWWDEILKQILACELFVFVLSPEALQSKACDAELKYATALERPILPVLVGSVNMDLVPEPIGQLNVLNYRERTPESTIDLLMAVASATSANVLPDPLPPSPPPPITDLGPVRERLAADSLSLQDQEELVALLRRRIDDVDQRPTVAALLKQLRSRSDIVEAIGRDVDILSDKLRLRSRKSGSPEETSSRDLIRSLVPHLRDGRITPITGVAMTDSLVGTRRQIAQDFAQYFDFPLARHQQEDMPQVAQFVTVMTNAETLRSRLRQHLAIQLQGHLDGEHTLTDEYEFGSLAELFVDTWSRLRSGIESDPHSVLARLPCPVFVTGHPASLIGAALREAGKEPVEEVCRWRPDVYDWPMSIFEAEPGYVPSANRPLVFHVFGRLEVPDSLVITEDDYMEFMIRTAEDKSLIPPSVRVALADSALLLLGFNLQDYDVRVLLRTLVGQEGAQRLHRYTHVAAQVDPTADVLSPDRARRYLERYFGKFRQPSIDIYWGTVDEFAADLSAVLGPVR